MDSRKEAPDEPSVSSTSLPTPPTPMAQAPPAGPAAEGSPAGSTSPRRRRRRAGASDVTKRVASVAEVGEGSRQVARDPTASGPWGTVNSAARRVHHQAPASPCRRKTQREARRSGSPNVCNRAATKGCPRRAGRPLKRTRRSPPAKEPRNTASPKMASTLYSDANRNDIGPSKDRGAQTGDAQAHQQVSCNCKPGAAQTKASDGAGNIARTKTRRKQAESRVERSWSRGRAKRRRCSKASVWQEGRHVRPREPAPPTHERRPRRPRQHRKCSKRPLKSHRRGKDASRTAAGPRVRRSAVTGWRSNVGRSRPSCFRVINPSSCRAAQCRWRTLGRCRPWGGLGPWGVRFWVGCHVSGWWRFDAVGC
jgi:hypothetical protein